MNPSSFKATAIPTYPNRTETDSIVYLQKKKGKKVLRLRHNLFMFETRITHFQFKILIINIILLLYVFEFTIHKPIFNLPEIR